MPLIKASNVEKVKQKFSIDESVFEEVKKYCEKFNVTLDDFANESFQIILRKDKDWKATKSKKAK